MQFNLEKGGEGRLIQKYQSGVVWIDGTRYNNSLILMGDELIADWPVADLDTLEVAHLQPIIDASPDIFLLGTGDKQVFPDTSLMVALARCQRSVDVMDSAAACRTYNVLVSEFRRVAVALILPDTSTDQA